MGSEGLSKPRRMVGELQLVGEARSCLIWIEWSRSTVQIVGQGFQVGELRSEREREVARVDVVVGRGGFLS